MIALIDISVINKHYNEQTFVYLLLLLPSNKNVIFLRIYFQVWEPQINLFCRAVFRISDAAASSGGVKLKSYLLAGIGSSH